jgi:tetratricopeptide (TPR) repeat protein
MPQPELMAGKYQESRGEIIRLRGQLDSAFDLLTECLVEAQRDGRVQDIFWMSIYDYMPLVLDMHRYRTWRDWASAEEILKEVIAMADRSGVLVGGGEAEARLSVVCARQGRIEEARQWLQRAQGQIAADPLIDARSFLMIAEAELAIAEGRWEDAIAQSEALLAWYTRAGMRWDQAHTLLDLAEIHLLRGHPGDQEQALDLFKRSTEVFSEIGAQGYVDIVQGRIQILHC